ncbi:MAG: response regulator transcription factor [Conexibacter sp.]
MTEQRSTILVVEDDRHTRTFLSDNLAADGFEPIGAGNAREAVRLMETRYPDLAIVDLTLPDRDGLDLLKQVRDADGVASRIDPLLPLLVLSGRIDELHRLRGFDKGADDVMAKPSCAVVSPATPVPSKGSTTRRRAVVLSASRPSMASARISAWTA